MEHSHWRGEFPITTDTVFFNHSAVSPLPLRAAKIGAAWLEERCRQASENYFSWLEGVARVRSLAANLIGVDPSRICFTGNTSWGLSLVASGLDWRAGDKVAVTWPDFPSVLFPWLNLSRLGVEVVAIPRREGRVDLTEAARICRGAKLVAASTVDWMTGTTVDVAGLGRICRQEGALFCLDAIQSLGVLPLDAQALGVDFLAAGCHKWLLGPMGLGLFYASAKAMGLLNPVAAGWHSVAGAEDLSENFQLKPDMGRFEPGTLDVPAILGLGASLDILAEVGVDNVRASIFALLGEIGAGLTERGLKVVSPCGPAERSSIMAFEHPDAPGLMKHFAKNRVAVSLRGGRIRLSPHFYNDAQDSRRFFQILDAYPG
jgi:selenocysteine lyase/cysteine desulfurase